ncbi:uncharacterized protein N7525_010929 [Penicillium rubens]|uniref:uncharacterized protein n=1 Tax=Penicillium rubens TaxID=1108849 RepID=UPI002A59F36B|nr:uncharacterized protein N7525_010929 [Penicillium rubens]KAJ5821645.1 hypothetical protein N7525_010929 [Penicillium rubens]
MFSQTTYFPRGEVSGKGIDIRRLYRVPNVGYFLARSRESTQLANGDSIVVDNQFLALHLDRLRGVRVKEPGHIYNLVPRMQGLSDIGVRVEDQSSKVCILSECAVLLSEGTKSKMNVVRMDAKLSNGTGFPPDRVYVDLVRRALRASMARRPSLKVWGYSVNSSLAHLFSSGRPQVIHFQGSPLGKVVPFVLTAIICIPMYILAGSGAAGAPVKFTVAMTWFPSGRKLPPARCESMAMQPVRRGLISGVQAPSSSVGATGGSGSSTTSIGSGAGGGG